MTVRFRRGYDGVRGGRGPKVMCDDGKHAGATEEALGVLGRSANLLTASNENKRAVQQLID